MTTGEVVRLTIGSWTVYAEIVLASENGRSLMLQYDGAAPIGDGYALRFLPVLRNDDGTWMEIVASTRVEVEAVPSYLCPVCGRRSYNPHDAENRYCGACHAFEDSPS